ncbi:hypothetical protein FQ000_08420 [Escherichia coli]|nr:hypothetical protein [Escherichia coli]EFB5410646.1 hypothetical protein [Escherichia coli]EFD0585704.1 hypothetical protein [Escherichia coli]EFE6876315.1 hypothetical protein [Escherichia coli]EFI9012643.1 hypothetical protein [Escherichia coli]
MSILLMDTIMGNGSVTLTTTVADQPDGCFFRNQKTLSPIRLTTSYTVTTGTRNASAHINS